MFEKSKGDNSRVRVGDKASPELMPWWEELGSAELELSSDNTVGKISKNDHES
jgi:hypothetical protein